MNGFSGAVLAGGQSKRFGSDKARYAYRGKPLLQWVLDSLSGASERFIVANRDYRDFGVPVHADIFPSGSALSGLHAALSHAQHDWVALAACDLPLLESAYWDSLLAQRDSEPVVTVGVAAAGKGARLEPLAALYHKELLPLVETKLQRGELSLQRLILEAGAKVLEPEGKGEMLRNINHLTDLPGTL